ncbi:hypothetical protein FDP41_012289 [Naegleria fowleri]|uniref:Uncharacterized protein n=1 Tax=Naegleria fowleri TaxID=5763 RepID=A0A6A5C4D6_NAEFO|nr:uncharacterized protein FDP41_012289 [Naegleria fowleri]KAF0981632.1 hypothetical protein FDP41_012289 [Naegleria fowleri]
MDNYHHRQHFTSSTSGSSGNTPSTKTPQEFMKEYENILKANPCDYYTWEKYITLMEIEFGMNPSSLDISQRLLDLYSQFLAQFPLLFGYWKKYAELTYQVTKDFNQTVQVYEKAIDKKTGISNNPDLWSHYCLFVAEQSQDVSEIRALFERALQAIGNDYYARILWEKYIEFETSQDELENVVKLYKRAIQVPCRDLTLIWSQFKDFMKTHTPKQEIPSSTTSSSDGKEQQESSQQILSVEQYAHTQEEMNAYKASNKLNDLITYWRENLYLPTKKELERIRPFEDHIRRPYFHVQPFQEHELEHFRRYIENEQDEFEKKNKWCTLEHVIQTHERFIVYCSYYTEFWNRYIKFLEKQNLHDQVIQVYQRLTNYSVLKNRYQVHIQFAEYLEMNHSKPEMIEKVYNDLITLRCVGHLESLTRAIHYLHRSKDNVEKIETIYREQEKNIAGTLARCYFKLQHANFVWKVRKDVERARILYNQCIDEFKTTKKAYQALIEFESDVVLTSTDNFTNDHLVEKLLNLEYYNVPAGAHEDDMQDEESVDRVVKHYLSLWGMPSPHVDSEKLSSKKNSSFVTISFKIEVLQLLLQRYVYQFQTIQTVQKVKDAIKRLQEEQYESQRKRRLENGVDMGVTSETKKLKSGEDQRWNLEQYKQYYQQYYQYYQQFTQI